MEVLMPAFGMIGAVAIICALLAGLFMLFGAKISHIEKATLGRSVVAAIATTVITIVMTLIFSILPIIGTFVGLLFGLLLSWFAIKGIYETTFGKALIAWVFNVLAQIAAVVIAITTFAGALLGLWNGEFRNKPAIAIELDSSREHIKYDSKIITDRLKLLGVTDYNISRGPASGIRLTMQDSTAIVSAKQILGRKGELKFYLLRKPPELQKVIGVIDSLPNKQSNGPNSFVKYLIPIGNQIGILANHFDDVQAILLRKNVQEHLEKAESRWLFGRKIETHNEGAAIPLYLVQYPEVLRIEKTKDAWVDKNGSNMKAQLNLQLNERDAIQFAKVTAMNIGRLLATCIDDTVYVAPMIRQKIPKGRIQISDVLSFDEAELLSVVLKTGILSNALATTPQTGIED